MLKYHSLSKNESVNLLLQFMCNTWDIVGRTDFFVVTGRETVNLKPIDVIVIIDVQCFMLYGFMTYFSTQSHFYLFMLGTLKSN